MRAIAVESVAKDELCLQQPVFELAIDLFRED